MANSADVEGELMWLRIGSGAPFVSWTAEQVDEWWEASSLPSRPPTLDGVDGAALGDITAETLVNQHGMAARMASGVAGVIRSAAEAKPPATDTSIPGARTAVETRSALAAAVTAAIATSMETDGRVQLTLGYRRAKRDDDGRTFYVNIGWRGHGETLDSVVLEVDYGGDSRPYRIDDGFCELPHGANVDAFFAGEWGAAIVADAMVGSNDPSPADPGPPPSEGEAAWHSGCLKEPFPVAHVSLMPMMGMARPTLTYLTRGQHLLALVERDDAGYEARRRDEIYARHQSESGQGNAP
jgi:hypothetical protein